MASVTLVLRIPKGSPLTNAEGDANFQGILNILGANSNTTTTSQTAMNSLAYNGATSLTGTSGYVLRSDGTNATLGAILSTDLTSALTAPPAIGATTPNTGKFTTLTATSDSAFTSTGYLSIPSGTTAQRPGSPSVAMLRYNTSTNQFEGYSGSSPSWLPVGGSIITNDTTTATQVYPLFSDVTTGTATTVYTGNSKLLYTPSTGELMSSEMVASNGLTVSNSTINSNYTIMAGYNVVSAGPVGVASGATVSISSGSVWVIL